MLISSLLFGISASLDALLVGISYGIRQIRIRFWQNLIISLVTLLGTCLSVGLGHKLVLFLPATIQGCAGSLILILLGLYYIVKWVIASLQNCRPKAPPEADYPLEITSASVKETTSTSNSCYSRDGSPSSCSCCSDGDSPSSSTYCPREASPSSCSCCSDADSPSSSTYCPREASPSSCFCCSDDALPSSNTYCPKKASPSSCSCCSDGDSPSSSTYCPRDDSPLSCPCCSREASSSPQLKLTEVFALSLTLSLNNLSAGLSASLAGLTLLPTAISTLICSILFLFSGNRLGQNPVLQMAGRAADPLSGALLIGLGLVQFFI